MVTQSCDLPERQNTDPLISLLAAATSVYGRAKMLMAVQFVLTIPAALASSVIMSLAPQTKVWLTFSSITIALVDVLFLSRAQANLRKRGATLQQMFDCKLFGLPWHPLRCGSPVDSEDIITEAKACLSNPKARARLVDWYPPAVKQLPLHLARLVCQRSSLSWDWRQRARVRGAFIALLSLLAVIVLLIALLRGNTVEQMILTVYVPLAPAILWAIRNIFAQRDSLSADEKALASVESLWNQAMANKLDEKELLRESILVQDALFDARSRSPMIFDWVYRLFRSRHQEQMEHKAAEMVQQALQHLSPAPTQPDLR